jgi:hypothetical protein
MLSHFHDPKALLDYHFMISILKIQKIKAMKKITSFILVALTTFIFMQGCKKDDVVDPLTTQNYTTFNAAMRELWSDHMQWTYSTVDAYFHDQPGLQAQLNRLLQNQRDIGAAIVPYYGQVAGDSLTSLLTTHIQQAVPVLQAAQSNNQPALDLALANWKANAKQIADFLSAANPGNWPKLEMEQMMEHHITTTTTYAVDLLHNDYTNAIIHYDLAFDHMMELANTLSKGIALQFPGKF